MSNLYLSFGTGFIATETIKTKINPEICNRSHINLFKLEIIASERLFEREAHENLENYNELPKCSCGYTHAFCECEQKCCLCGEDIVKPTNLIYW